jgi:hypothetical protein
VQLVLARMRLGVVLSMIADRSSDSATYDKAIKLFEEELEKKPFCRHPSLQR